MTWLLVIYSISPAPTVSWTRKTQNKSNKRRRRSIFWSVKTLPYFVSPWSWRFHGWLSIYSTYSIYKGNFKKPYNTVSYKRHYGRTQISRWERPQEVLLLPLWSVQRILLNSHSISDHAGVQSKTSASPSNAVFNSVASVALGLSFGFFLQKGRVFEPVVILGMRGHVYTLSQHF